MKHTGKTSRILLLLLVILCTTFAVSHTASAASSGKWVTSGGKIKYKSAKGKYIKNQFKEIGGSTFYFDKKGYVVTGLMKRGGDTFYFSRTGAVGKKGKMLTGWRTVNGKTYYFRKVKKGGIIGAAYAGTWVTISGTDYYFNKDGTLNTETMTQEEFIETIGKLARKDMKKSGILASVTTAQAILESGYGTSSLALEAHNLFGMKAMLSSNTWKSAWKGDTFTKTTQEYLNKKWYTIKDTFRSYDSFEESVADHSAYLRGAKNGNKLRYAGVIGNKSYKKTVQLIKKGGYATDPGYVSKLCSIIKKYKLTRFDK